MLTVLQHWLHLIAATVWIGSQVFLIAVVVPSLRVLSNPSARHRLTNDLTRRYNLLGWGALMVLLVTGVLNALDAVPSLSQLVDSSYGRWLLLKVAAVAGILGATALHTFWLGPRMLTFPPETDPRHPPLRRLHRQSAFFSAVNLLLAFVAVWAAATLRWGL